MNGQSKTMQTRQTLFHGMRAFLLPLLLLPIMIGVNGCQSNPATGGDDFLIMTPSEQRALGEQADAQIVAQYGELNDQEMQALVERIGREVVAQSGDDRFDYVFRVLDSEVINAFALPGGFIYVTRGLLEYLNNDAQLAMVLGHEVGHVAANHSAIQYRDQNLANIGLVIGGAVFEEIQPFLGAASQGLQLLFLSYSRAHETQSDTLGVMYATKAGYEAAEGAKFFETLQQLSAQAGSSIPEWASTHPDPANREENIITKAAEWEAAVGGTLGGVNPEVYIPRLDDMVFGVNPRNGFVQGNTFYHPDLQLQFPIPSGWLFGNFSSQVQMASPDQDAGIIFMLADASSPAAAASAMQAEQGVTTVSSESGTVNGFQAVRLETRIAVEGGTLGVLSYFIEKDQTVYLFHGYTDQAKYNGYENTFESVFTNFRAVTDPTILNRQPYRLNAIIAAQTASFSALVSPNPGAGLDILSLAILNQVEVNTQIAQGTHLKEVQ